ncbi:MAG TPA: SRPBCC domain-containing protein [Terriglobia bacterium]|nr:SRPBCC domain-containing protein [Terriglobia bacterium]
MQTRIIRQKAFFRGVQPMELYEALINARKHAAFTGAAATSTARVGGKFTAWDGYIQGRHLELEPGRRIVQEWRTTEWPAEAPPSRLEWRFQPKRGGTEMILIHSQVPASQAASYRQGWIDYYWNPLKAYVARRGKS